MKGEGESVPITLWLIFAFIMGVVGIVVFVIYVGSAGQTQCWRESISDLRPVTGAFEIKTLGVGALIGRETFKVGFEARGACLEKVVFDDEKACKEICQGTEHFDPDEEKCLKQCAWCKEPEDKKVDVGCIILVPKTPQSVFEIFKKGPLDYLKATRANIKVFNTPGYAFSPETITGPDEGVKKYCLTFSRDETNVYSISKDRVGEIEECEEDELGIG